MITEYDLQKLSKSELSELVNSLEFIEDIVTENCLAHLPLVLSVVDIDNKRNGLFKSIETKNLKMIEAFACPLSVNCNSALAMVYAYDSQDIQIIELLQPFVDLEKYKFSFITRTDSDVGLLKYFSHEEKKKLYTDYCLDMKPWLFEKLMSGMDKQSHMQAILNLTEFPSAVPNTLAIESTGRKKEYIDSIQSTFFNGYRFSFFEIEELAFSQCKNEHALQVFNNGNWTPILQRNLRSLKDVKERYDEADQEVRIVRVSRYPTKTVLNGHDRLTFVPVEILKTKSRKE